MRLAERPAEQLTDSRLSYVEKAQMRCQLAKGLCEKCDYEGAQRALSDLWPRAGERLNTDGLDAATAAEVLLRVGSLMSRIRISDKSKGANETVEELLNDSVSIFKSLADRKKVAESLAELGYAISLRGDYEEARNLLLEARLLVSDDEDTELKASILLLSAIAERVSRRLHDALRLHVEAAPFFEKAKDDALKGRYHSERARTLRRLGEIERNDVYLERALTEYASASLHLKRAGCELLYVRAECEFALALTNAGRGAEAYARLDEARGAAAKLSDKSVAARVEEIRARALLAEGRLKDAERIAYEVVQALDKGDDRSLLAEALTTHGKTLARTGNFARAHLTLQRAVIVAEEAGEVEKAGLFALTIIEELNEYSAPEELKAVYERAAELLADSHDMDVSLRMISCARVLMRALIAQEEKNEDPLDEFSPPTSLEGVVFKDEVRRYERFLVERALKKSNGVVTRAAQMLGFKHHYSLITLMNHRHRDLLPARSPVIPRRRSILRREAGSSSRKSRSKNVRPATILHVEDNEIVSDLLREALEAEGWKVETCTDGLAALAKLASDDDYELLLVDNNLPGLSGLEILRMMRKLPHRKRLPAVMLSADECEADALRAGANAFLRKPKGVTAVTETIARLIR